MIGIFAQGREETPGVIQEILDQSGQQYRIYSIYETGEVPKADLTHLLILGGTMSVNDEREYSWLSDEKECIRKMAGRRRPVLGICLGAQMIASAFGASVSPSQRETGWSDVTWVGNVPGIPPGGRLRVFQWHGETFDLPHGAIPLCTGDIVRNQGFLYQSALGVQFHPEVTAGIIDRWTAGLPPGQQAAIRAEPLSSFEGSRHICRAIMEAFVNGDMSSAP